MEFLFSILFVGFIFFIPFILGRNCGRAFKNLLFLPSYLPFIRKSSGKIVGYLEAPHDSENDRDYHIIVEYAHNGANTLWAMNSIREQMIYTVGSTIDFYYHANDPQYIINRTMQFAKIEVKFLIYVHLVFSAITIGSLLYYFVASNFISFGIIISYILGAILGLSLQSEIMDKIFDRKDKIERNNLLNAAQKEGIIPCHIKIKK